MNNNMLVNICVVCSHTNQKNNNGFPLVCPQMKMPCFAIHPDYLFSKNNLLMASLDFKGRVPMKFIDKEFLDSMNDGYDEIVKRGVDTTGKPVY